MYEKWYFHLPLTPMFSGSHAGCTFDIMNMSGAQSLKSSILSSTSFQLDYTMVQRLSTTSKNCYLPGCHHEPVLNDPDHGVPGPGALHLSHADPVRGVGQDQDLDRLERVAHQVHSASHNYGRQAVLQRERR